MLPLTEGERLGTLSVYHLEFREESLRIRLEFIGKTLPRLKNGHNPHLSHIFPLLTFYDRLRVRPGKNKKATFFIGSTSSEQRKIILIQRYDLTRVRLKCPDDYINQKGITDDDDPIQR